MIHSSVIMHELELRASEISDTLKLIAHPKRLLILCKLASSEKSVGELEKLCDISQSQLSQFLSKLKEEGILEARKDGQYVFYRIRDTRILSLITHLQNEWCSIS